MAASYDQDQNETSFLCYSDMPATLRQMLEQAEKIDAATPETLRTAIGLIDHTSLQDSATPMEGAETVSAIKQLCNDAKNGAYSVAAVCVYPNHIETSSEALRDSHVKIAAVNDFPHGDAAIQDATIQAQKSIARGAHEIDTVVAVEACLEKTDLTAIKEKLEAVSAVCRAHDAVLKIILQGSVYKGYGRLYKVAQTACEICRDGDFIKTCTGKLPKDGFGNGAADVSTLSMSATVMQAVADYNAGHGTAIGVKISGGVKTSVDCERYKYIVGEIMGADCFNSKRFRFGASSLRNNLQADLAQNSAGTSPIKDDNHKFTR